MIKLSAFADEVSVHFEEQLKFLQNEGVDYIELRFVNGKNILDLDKKEIIETDKLLSHYNIKVSAIASPIGKVKVTEPFQPHLDKFKHAVDLAYYFDTKLIRIFSYYPPDSEIHGTIYDYRNIVMERMNVKAELLKDTVIIMAHENESHIYGHNAENCVDIVTTTNSPNLKLAYDPANFVWGESITNNVELCWPLMKPYTSHIHIKDWKLGSKDVGCQPGEGDGQIERLIQELGKMNYDGFITMEPHLNHGGQFGGETTPEQFSEAIRRTKEFCKEAKLI